MPGSSKTRHPAERSLQGVKVVDLFCGVGGLSHGLKLEGFDVVAGIDIDPSCRHAYERNNGAKFILRDVARFTTNELDDLFRGAGCRVLVGCAPCQPYSSLNRRTLSPSDARKHWYPLYRFMNLIKKARPDIVSMENVPDLSNTDKYPVFADFIDTLQVNGYHVSYRRVDASRYGVPQRRNRLVLLASRLGPIELVPETHPDNPVTVRQTIGELPPIEDGAVDASDPLHRASKLSPKNRERIAATPRDGGSAKSWPSRLMPECYKKNSGKTYMATVYGRMKWDAPAPTMTTQCTTLGTGRFGHPEQNRAITLREAALLQTFPRDYDFGRVEHMGIVAKHLGNAVPVELGRAIARSIKHHICGSRGV